jgi:hypothetical protein
MTAPRPGDNNGSPIAYLDSMEESLYALASGGGVTIKPSSGPLTDRSGTVTVGGVAQPVMAANSARKYLFFQNMSSGNLWISMTGTATAGAAGSKLIPPGGGWESGTFVPTGAISVYGATTGQAYTAEEG